MTEDYWDWLGWLGVVCFSVVAYFVVLEMLR